MPAELTEEMIGRIVKAKENLQEVWPKIEEALKIFKEIDTELQSELDELDTEEFEGEYGTLLEEAQATVRELFDEYTCDDPSEVNFAPFIEE